MSINSLTSWITSSNKFQREYTCLLKKSVCSQISNLIRDNSENDENIVDWAYLISCASILAHSTDGTVLDIVFVKQLFARLDYKGNIKVQLRLFLICPQILLQLHYLNQGT